MSDSTESIILVTVITATVPAILGIIIWYFKLKYNASVEQRKADADRIYKEQQETAKKELTEQMERYALKIKEFYYPIYIRLVANEQAYRKVIGPRNSNTIPIKIRRAIMKNEILIAHEHIIKIIIDHAHMVEGDSELLHEFIKYTQHVAVLKTIFSVKGCDVSAKDLGSPYPTTLLPTLHNRFMTDSKIYNDLIGYTVYRDNSLLNIQDTVKNVISTHRMNIHDDDSESGYTNTTEDYRSYRRDSATTIDYVPSVARSRCEDVSLNESVGDRTIDITSLSKMRESLVKWDRVKLMRRRTKDSSPDNMYNSSPSVNDNYSVGGDVIQAPGTGYLTE